MNGWFTVTLHPAEEKASDSMLCDDCREAGRAIMGFTTIGGRRYCGDHAAKRGWKKPDRKRSEVQEITMKDKAIDWEAIEKDLDAGMKPKEAASNHEIPVQTIYAHQSYRKKQKKSGSRTAINTRSAPHTTSANGNIAAALELLRKQREQISMAIEALENL